MAATQLTESECNRVVSKASKKCFPYSAGVKGNIRMKALDMLWRKRKVISQVEWKGFDCVLTLVSSSGTGSFFLTGL